jgi:cyclopropane fatty-acyl-phospholipid synthase-like methyltransferase
MNVFEKHYLSTGFESQRKYPNEGLLAFLGGNYFSIPFGERSKIKVLELGCGSGANLWAVAKEGFDAYGIDIAPTGVELCEKMLEKWSATATIRLGDMTTLPYEAGFFDAIFDVVSMQHLTMEQHYKSYSEVRRCLKKGGRFFSYHLGENSISLKSTSDLVDHCTVANIAEGYPLANNGQTCFISANEVRRFLQDTGFKNVIIEKVLRSYSNQRQHIEYLSISAEAYYP